MKRTTNILASLLGMAVITATIVSTFRPVSVEAKDKKTLTLKDANTVVLNGVVDDETIRDVKLALLAKASKLYKTDAIYIFLNTPGGSLPAGETLIEVAKGLPNPIHTIVRDASSMGFVIAQSLDKRYILSSGQTMSHLLHAGGLSGSIPGNMFSRYKSILDRVEEIDAAIVKRSKITEKQYKEIIRDEMWLTAQQALKMGFADEIVGVSCDKSMESNYDREVNIDLGFIVIPLKVTFSKCPLILEPIKVALNLPEEKKAKKEEKKKDEVGPSPAVSEPAKPLLADLYQKHFPAAAALARLMFTNPSEYYNNHMKGGSFKGLVNE